MKFEKVSASSFGPFSDESLTFSEGLNIVYGPNEAGKSTWHAALYAGLCGFRRGRGRNTIYGAFKEKHRPWHAEAWRAILILRLEDHRRVELTQNLDDRSGSATDADMGRDYTSEIIEDQAPDGSKWLGLTRDVFPAIACVRQAQIILSEEDPEALQAFLQRAAATFGTDATAAQALASLDEFKKEHVGTLRATTKPLAQATEAVQQAEAQLAKARQSREEYGLRTKEKADLASRLQRTSLERRRMQAALEHSRANKAEEHYKEAVQLSERYPQEPRKLSEGGENVQMIAAALESWENRPSPVEPPSPSSAELQAQLSEIEDPGPGDTEPDPSVERALKEFERQSQRLQDHHSNKPESVSRPPVPETIEPDQLKEWAEQLSRPEPLVDRELQSQYDELGRKYDALQRAKSRNKILLAFAGMLLVAGLILLALDQKWPAFLTLAFAVGAGVTYLVRNPEGRLNEILRHRSEINDQLGTARLEHELWKDKRAKVMAALQHHGLPNIPEELKRLSRALGGYNDFAREEERRKSAFQRLEQEEKSARESLAALLREKQIDPTSDPITDAHRYRDQCRIRKQRKELQTMLTRTLKEEKQIRDVESRREEALKQLQETGRRCGIDSTDPEEIVDGLKAWRKEYGEKVAQYDREIREYQRLQSLLDGRSLDDLRQEVEERQASAESLRSDFSAEELENVDLEDIEEEIEALKEQEHDLEMELARADTELENLTKQEPSVSECEEALETAHAELKRVQLLGDTLEKTRTFLEKAQEEVHRNIAPILADSIRPWLPRIADGRYVDVRIDPQNLSVRVQTGAGDWREAFQLSHGTIEQIYLLLRIALTSVLSTDPKCPMILDDVTVQSDAIRTRCILEMLHELSRERQIIFFTQEQEVLEWAKERLEPDSIIELSEPVPA